MQEQKLVIINQSSSLHEIIRSVLLLSSYSLVSSLTAFQLLFTA